MIRVLKSDSIPNSCPIIDSGLSCVKEIEQEINSFVRVEELSIDLSSLFDLILDRVSIIETKAEECREINASLRGALEETESELLEFDSSL